MSDYRWTVSIYAGTHSQGLWKSTNRGHLWQNLNLPESNVYSIAISPADGSVYAGTEPSKLFKSVDGGQTWDELSALRSIPSAPTWSFPPKPWTSHVRWIAPNPENLATTRNYRGTYNQNCGNSSRRLKARNE